MNDEIIKRIIQKAPAIAEEMKPQEIMEWIVGEILGSPLLGPYTWRLYAPGDFDWSSLAIEMFFLSRDDSLSVSNLARGRLKTVTNTLEEMAEEVRSKERIAL